MNEESRTRREPVPLWGFEKPPPPRWAVDRFIPEGFATVLAADGGVGKSFLALLLAVCVATGRPFLGVPVRRCRVLYVDYELDEPVQKHRLFRVLEGLGLTPDDPSLDGWLYYYRPEERLPRGIAEVAAVVEDKGIALVVLDSLTVASTGDATAQQDMTNLMQGFRRWGTVFALDHVSGFTARGNHAEARPFGSVFKRNIARSTFSLAKADGGGYILRPDKTNLGPQQDLLCYGLDFDGDDGAVTFSRLDVTDEAMTGATAHMKAAEVTALAVAELWADPGRGFVGVTAGEVVGWLEQHDLPPRKAGTIQNHFTALRRRGVIEPDGEGTWRPTAASPGPSQGRGSTPAGDGQAGPPPPPPAEPQGPVNDEPGADEDLFDGDTDAPF